MLSTCNKCCRILFLNFFSQLKYTYNLHYRPLSAFEQITESSWFWKNYLMYVNTHIYAYVYYRTVLFNVRDLVHRTVIPCSSVCQNDVLLTLSFSFLPVFLSHLAAPFLMECTFNQEAFHFPASVSFFFTVVITSTLC